MIMLINAARRATRIALAGLVFASTLAGAQTGVDSVGQLGRYIRILAGSPRDLTALLGAGRAALDVGDPNAALGFFARAEEISPSNGLAKAGLGASLVAIERPDDALRLFAQAVSMGVPEANIARDRGLAYDLRGDNRRAQRDYALAMTQGRDDELMRRYALSLGIAGDRAGALAMLDPLLQRQDQGAWRARAFVLAMTGDVPGADKVARQLMVPAMANAMAPLLARLAKLNAAERAHAVTFGTVPTDGTQLAVQTGDPYLPAGGGPVAQGSRMAEVSRGSGAPGWGLIPSGAALGPANGELKPVPRVDALSMAPRRRPDDQMTGAVSANSAGTAATPTVPRDGEMTSTRVVRVERSKNPAAQDVVVKSSVPVPTVVPGAMGSPAELAATPPPPPSAPVRTAADDRTPAFETPPLPVVVAKAPETKPRQSPPMPIAPATKPGAGRLAGLLAGLEPEAETAINLPNAREIRLARAAARRKIAQLAVQAEAERAAQAEAAARAIAIKRFPGRIWVQVATGRNDAGLALSWKRIRSDHEALLKAQPAWSAPYRATNRILIGPFRSPAAAHELIRKLAQDGLSTTPYDSEAGEEVVKIGAK